MASLCFTSGFMPALRPVAGVATTARVAPQTPVMMLRSFGTGRFGGKAFELKNGLKTTSPLRVNMVDEAIGSGGGKGGSGGGGGGGGGGSGGVGGVFGGIWRAYNDSLESQPILTKALTSLVGFLLGDLLAQKFLSDKDTPLDRARLARMASFGFLLHGPIGHYFYGALDRVIVGKTPLKVASKVFVDQVLWAPIFTMLFFTYLGVAERKSQKEIVDKLKQDTINGVTASWKFWPVAHAINFAFVPTQQRLLYINTLQVGYNVILSFLGNKEVVKTDEKA